MLATGLALFGLLFTASPAMATGDADVIAQHVVSLAEGDHHWVVAPVPVTAEPTTGTAADATFLAVVAGSVTLADDEATAQYDLDAGEAAVVLAGDSYTQWTPDADQPAELLGITLASGTASGADDEVGDAFPLAPGEYDLELIRDVLGPAEILTLPAGAAPTLVRVDGVALVTSDATASATELAAGAPEAFPGALTIVNLGDQPVSVLATSVTPIAGAGTPTASSEPPDSSEATESPAAAPTTAGGAASTSVGPTSSSATPTSSTSTTAPAPGDTLDPGAINTTPSSFQDTDNDGLTDAEEAAFGSDPNHFDTDTDALTDDREAYLGTDPRNPDTDGDGMEDGFEDIFFDDPLDPTDYPGAGEVDTDGDRYSDNLETLIGYDPNDPSSHP